ncbi:class I adenylate-forming enzyme family protein [Alteribacillus sp. YIM 98480]|uniref:class I adenylate-forming enzyme family protein n=1 Tax=Alteribacillus sp. YIM 98480 TaxID=2606599 RepID=UPI00131DEE03|nr:long-chain-fatty-acid--CoA ligase [Alteribacillus sp. YIM 98480]
MNLAFSLERQAWRKPTAEAVRYKENTYTYKFINQQTNAYVNLLINAGVNKGDRVAVWLPNSMEFIYLFYAVLKLGAIVVPLNYMFKIKEAEYILSNSETKILFTTSEKANDVESVFSELPHLEMIMLTDTNGLIKAPTYSVSEKIKEVDQEAEAIDLSPDVTACILYTSGTTGQPKGVELTHYNLNTNAEFYAEGIQLNEDHFGCIVTPLSHLLVLMAGLLLIFMKGGKFRLFERFDLEVVAETIHNEHISFFIGVPTMYYMFLTLPNEKKFHMNSLDICLTSGGHMPLEVRKKFEKTYETQVLQAYGQTESSPVITVDRRDIERRFESVGYPLPHLDVKIMDSDGNELPPGKEGEIVVSGHCVMKGYWKKEAETKKTIKNGYLYTGDIGRLDKDGYVYLLDRKKDLIIVGGYNVYPVELENVLYEHPSVLEAAVIGESDDRLGEIPKAFIVPKKGTSPKSEDIQAFCKKQLAPYKQIRKIQFVDKVPKTPTGKLMKRKLKEWSETNQYTRNSRP